MKIGVMTTALNEERFIVPCIRQFKPFGFKHIVSINESTQTGNPHAKDNTDTIAKSEGAEVIYCKELRETEQRNFAMSHLDDCDWIIIVDADELYTKNDIEKIIKTAETSDPTYSWRNGNMLTFWHDFNHIVTGTTEYTMLVPKHTRFYDKRHIGSNHQKIKDITCYHMSYARSYDEMKRKITSFAHAPEVSPDWLDKKWAAWTEDMTDLHPTNPRLWERAIFYKLPDEIRAYFDNDKII